MTSVELHQIDHHFGEIAALRNLDLRIEPGQYVVLLGQSGCGKTTALRVIAGLQKPTGGSVSLGDQCVDAVPPRNRPLAMVFQQPAVYPHLNVAQIIRFGLTSVQTDKHVNTAIELAGVGGWLDRYPDQLSGGQLRRVAIAKAVAKGQPLRLLDEPLSALDTQTSTQIEQDLRHLHNAVGGTTIHVTHDANEAMRVADKIAVMHDGQIAQFDTPNQLYTRPNSVQVAQGLGSLPINLFQGTVHDNKISFSNDDLQCSGSWAEFLDRFGQIPKEVTIGVRPENFHAESSDAGEDSDNQPRLRIAAANARQQAMGRLTHWTWERKFQTIRAVTTDSSQVAQSLSISACDMLLFDTASGTLIDTSVPA